MDRRGAGAAGARGPGGLQVGREGFGGPLRCACAGAASAANTRRTVGTIVE